MLLKPTVIPANAGIQELDINISKPVTLSTLT